MRLGLGLGLGFNKILNSILKKAMRTADDGAMESASGNIMISAGKE